MPVNLLVQEQVYSTEIGVELTLYPGKDPIVDSGEFLLVHWDAVGTQRFELPRPINEKRLSLSGYRPGKDGPMNYCYAVVSQHPEDRRIFTDWVKNRPDYFLALAEQALVWAIGYEPSYLLTTIRRVTNLMESLQHFVAAFPQSHRDQIDSVKARALERLFTLEQRKLFVVKYRSVIGELIVDDRAAAILMPRAIDRVRFEHGNHILYLGRVEIKGIGLLVTMSDPLPGLTYRDVVGEIGMHFAAPLTGIVTGERTPLEGMVVRRQSLTNFFQEWWVSPPPFDGRAQSLSSSGNQSVFALLDEDEPFIGDIAKE